MRIPPAVSNPSIPAFLALASAAALSAAVPGPLHFESLTSPIAAFRDTIKGVRGIAMRDCCEGSAGQPIGIDTAGVLRASADRGATFGLITHNHQGTATIDKVVFNRGDAFSHILDSAWMFSRDLGTLRSWRDYRKRRGSWGPAPISGGLDLTSDGFSLFAWTREVPVSGYSSVSGTEWKRYDASQILSVVDPATLAANPIVKGYPHCKGHHYEFMADAADGLVKRVYKKSDAGIDAALDLPKAGTAGDALASWACLETGFAFANSIPDGKGSRTIRANGRAEPMHGGKVET